MAAADKAMPRVDPGEGRRHRGVPVADQRRLRASAGSAAAAFSACATRRTAAGRRRRFSPSPAAASARRFGAQAIDLVLVINNQRGLEQLVKNQFKIGADAAVAAGPVGRDASAVHRHPDARADPQLLARARAVCRRDAQRIDDPPGSRCQRALLRHGVPHRSDRVRWLGRRARTRGRLEGDADEIRT